MEEPENMPRILTPSSSGRRRSGDSNSPEFEFWMARNPSFPEPNLLSADELFSDGILLPLQVLHISNDIPAPSPEDGEVSSSDCLMTKAETSSAAESAQLSASSAFISSKRWRDIFKKNEKKSNTEICGVEQINKGKEFNYSVKEKKREKKNGGAGGNGGSASIAELNINIWPFSRSRSAGTGGTRPRSTTTVRKVSSAPCSRSNSSGESKSRKWPSSPRRAAGVHVGRTSPVWQVRRSDGGGCGSSETLLKKDSCNNGRRRIPGAGFSKAKAFTLNVPMCIDYRHHLSCSSDVNRTNGIAAPAASRGGEGVRGSNLFNIRSLFAKKVY